MTKEHSKRAKQERAASNRLSNNEVSPTWPGGLVDSTLDCGSRDRGSILILASLFLISYEAFYRKGMTDRDSSYDEYMGSLTGHPFR